MTSLSSGIYMYSFFMYFMCVLLFCFNNRSFINSLIILEVMMLLLFFFLSLFMIKESELMIMMYFMVVVVCEGSVGLSLFVKIIRAQGSSFFKVSSFSTC